jgi:hypothetical protein
VARIAWRDGETARGVLNERRLEVVHLVPTQTQRDLRQPDAQDDTRPEHSQTSDGPPGAHSTSMSAAPAQAAFDRELNTVDAPIIDETGLRRMELHLAPMSDFTDDTWFHRTAWRYCRSWPGVPYAPEGPKSGQILVFDDTTTYSLRAFSKQRGHNPLFTASEGGYVLCADGNDNEAVKPKGYRIHRARPPKWSVKIPVRAVAMVLAGNTLFLAGPPNVIPEDDPYAALEGRRGAKLWAVSASDGGRLSEQHLEAVPIFDGMAAAEGRLFISTEGGEVICFGP